MNQPPTTAPNPALRRVMSALSLRTIGAAYVLLLLIVMFGYLEPEAFFAKSTLLIILNGSAVSGIVALGVIIPLAAGIFDVSVGYLIALGGTLSAYLVAHYDVGGLTAVLLTLLIGACVTLINVIVVVVLRIPSLIGTLATGLLFLAMITGLSNQQQITQNVERLSDVAGHSFGTIGMPLIVLAVLTVVVWFTLALTPLGRQWYAIGYDPETSRLAGIKVSRLQGLALVASGLCAILAGILITGRIGAGSPTTGPDYLLPAFTAAFVGATQFTPGRFNALGTVLAVYVLGTATIGLSIVGAPVWVAQLLQGLILIAAVAVDSLGSDTDDDSILNRMRRSLKRSGATATDHQVSAPEGKVETP